MNDIQRAVGAHASGFPFITLRTSLVLLRVTTAFMFLAHAGMRVANGSVSQFGAFLESRGFPRGEAWVWGITAFELLGGLTMALGRFTRWLALGFIGMLLIGIALIHARLGWFVGEHGTGGSEYSVILIAALIVVAAADRRAS